MILMGNIYTISVHILSEKNFYLMINKIAVNKIKNMVPTGYDFCNDLI